MPKITQQNLNEYISEYSIAHLTLRVFRVDKSVKYSVLNLKTDEIYNKYQKMFICNDYYNKKQDWFLRECRYDTIANTLDDINYIVTNPNKFLKYGI